VRGCNLCSFSCLSCLIFEFLCCLVELCQCCVWCITCGFCAFVLFKLLSTHLEAILYCRFLYLAWHWFSDRLEANLALTFFGKLCKCCQTFWCHFQSGRQTRPISIHSSTTGIYASNFKDYAWNLRVLSVRHFTVCCTLTHLPDSEEVVPWMISFDNVHYVRRIHCSLYPYLSPSPCHWKALHGMMLPPPSFVVGMVLDGWWAVLGFRQT